MKVINLLFCLFFCHAAFSQKEINLYAYLSENSTVELSHIARRIHYIPLETTSDCLLSNELQIYYASDFIFIGDQLTNTFYRFDKDGKFLNRIGKKGEGSQEYPDALFFFVDEKEKVINLISPQTKALYQYNYTGLFLAKIQFSESPWMITLLNNNYVFYNNRFNRIKDTKNVQELFLANRKGEIIASLPTTIKDKEMDMLLFEFPFFYKYNNQLFYKNPLLDDIFQITTDFTLKSQYKIKTGHQTRRNDDYKNIKRYAQHLSVRSVFENDSILLLTFVYQDKFQYLLIEKEHWKVVHVGGDSLGFVDDIYGGPLFYPYWLFNSEQNLLLSLLTAGEIEKQASKFNEIAKKQPSLRGRNIDENPILVLLELK